MYEPERSHGWAVFAAIVIAVAGAWNLILGIATFTRKEYFDESSMLYSNLSFWGVVWIIIGALQLLTAILVARGSVVGRVLGLMGASVSLLVWFFSIAAHPVSSVVVIVGDFLVLYALTSDREYISESRYRVDPERDPRLEPRPRVG
jgi:hypothetical protein